MPCSENFRATVEAERAAQDAALPAASRTLAVLQSPVPVLERDAEPVHWAAVVQTVVTDPARADAATDRANDGFAALHNALCQRGNHR